MTERKKQNDGGTTCGALYAPLKWGNQAFIATTTTVPVQPCYNLFKYRIISVSSVISAPLAWLLALGTKTPCRFLSSPIDFENHVKCSRSFW